MGGEQGEPAWSPLEGWAWETLWGSCGISLLGLSAEDYSSPQSPPPAPLSLQPKGGRHPRPHSPIPRGWVEARQPTGSRGAVSIPSPPPVPKVTSSLVSPGHRNKRRHKTQGSPPVRRQWQRRVRQERQGGHSPALSLPLSPPHPNLSLPCVFVCFVSKEFTEREGRASSGGRKAGRCRWCVGRRRTRRPPGR